MLDELQSSEASAEEIERKLQSLREAEMREDRLREQQVKAEPLTGSTVVMPTAGAKRNVSAAGIMSLVMGDGKIDRVRINNGNYYYFNP